MQKKAQRFYYATLHIDVLDFARFKNFVEMTSLCIIDRSEDELYENVKKKKVSLKFVKTKSLITFGVLLRNSNINIL